MHTIVPWNVEGATYATNYAGPNPFDVSYQTSTDLTGLGTKGVLEVLNTSKWLDSPAYASTKAKFIPNTITKSTYQGKLYGLPCIIGGTVIYYNKDLLGEGRRHQHPANTSPSSAAAAKIAEARQRHVWGHNVSLSNKDFTWYFLYHDLHNRGIDIISKDQSKVTFNSRRRRRRCSATVDMILKYKVQPPVGQYDREAGVSLFKAGRIGFLARRAAAAAGLPRREAPVQVGLRQPDGRSGRQADDLLDDRPLGHGLEEQEQGRRLGARQVPVLARVRERRSAQHYGWAPVRSDVNTSKGDDRRSSGSTATS